MRQRTALRRGVVLAVAVLMVFALPAFADVDNGSFEDPEVPGGVAFFTESEVPGWTVEWSEPALACGGGVAPLLEIQENLLLTAVDGDQYVELDTDCVTSPDVETNVRISQDIDTVAGYNYSLWFNWAARTQVDQMELKAGNRTEVYDLGVPEPTTILTWDEETVVFTAEGATSSISFEETGTANSLGMLLDAVSCAFCISDPVVTDLVRGRKKIDVGDITVTHDDEYVYVEFMTDGPWVVYKTHVELVADLDDFPRNRGGLIPGQLTYGSGPYVPGVSNDTIMIPIPEVPGSYYVAFHAELLKISAPGYHWATEVVDSDQGLRWNGTPVPAGRSDPADALDAPDGQLTAPVGFFSLGFGGSITVAFDGYLYNSHSPYEFAGVEITGGSSYPEESATVEFYYDGAWYEAAGELTNQPVDGGDPMTFTYLQLPAEIPYAEKVRITDTTDPGLFATRPLADGFDLDAVKARKLVRNEQTGWGLGEEAGRNWSMYFMFDFNCPDYMS